MSPLEFLAEFAYRRTIIGTSIIGIAAGMLGCHLYLRKQALLSDVVGHSAVAGVMAGFIIAASLGANGQSMIVVILGALASGLAAVLISTAVAHRTRLGEDATMAVTLALFFGGGMVLLQIIQKSTLPGKGGISEIMFGNAATLTNADVRTIAIVAALVLILAAVLHRPFSILTFDHDFAASTGYRPALLSPLQLGLVVLSIVIGIKAVGLILMVAFAIFPAAAARLWTRSLTAMMPLAGLFGALGAVAGSYASVAVGDMPTGPVIVIALAVILAFSLAATTAMHAVKRRVRS
ncbi:metal ABC transporter permease [Corynebacterium sp. 335C]